MKPTFFKGALVGGIAGAVMAAGTVALAGSGIGGVFNLGQSNTVNATTGLSGSVAAPQLKVTNTDGGGTGIRATHAASSGSGAGVQGNTSSSGAGATGVSGSATSSSAAGDSNGVKGVNNGAGRGVYGQGSSGPGVYGNSTTGYGVWGIGSYGLVGSGPQGGVWTSTDGPAASGVYAQTTAAGTGSGVHGVHQSTNGTGPGVLGETNAVGWPTDWSAAGVRGVAKGDNNYTTGVVGVHPAASGAGVAGCAGVAVDQCRSGDYGVGVYGRVGSGASWAGDFWGNVHISGKLDLDGGCTGCGRALETGGSASQAGSYSGHGSEPHVYSGNVTTNPRGFVPVTMPRSFQETNRSFRYQLTVLGHSFAQAIVWRELRGNRFTIRTSQPNVQVSWQVTAAVKEP